jgi:hypothetical protein
VTLIKRLVRGKIIPQGTQSAQRKQLSDLSALVGKKTSHKAHEVKQRKKHKP